MATRSHRPSLSAGRPLGSASRATRRRRLGRLGTRDGGPQAPDIDSEAVMRQALARMRYVAGIPSVLVVALAATFYLLVNALTAWSEAEFGQPGVWATVVLSAALTAILFARWQRRFSAALQPKALGQPGTAKLTSRRGAVVLVGLDSADPGTTFTRLLATAEHLEYLALIATPQAEVRGVVPALPGPPPAASRSGPGIRGVPRSRAVA